ncbi:MAG: NADH-ubiquinone oxidoreductase-F iron-sulfur binding region domain-containing protein [Desulfotomaculales bacterium]
MLFGSAPWPEVAPTTVILDAANQAGVRIPLKCYFLGLDEGGAEVVGVVRVIAPCTWPGFADPALPRIMSVMRDLIGHTWSRSICWVEITRLLLELVQENSCGNCVPCRVGTRRMLDIVDRVLRGRTADLFVLEQLGKMARLVGSSAKCDLGRLAGKLVASTVLCRREEFITHASGSCPGTIPVDVHLGTIPVRGRERDGEAQTDN